MSEKHRLLLKDAALLYGKHEAGRPEPFNVFSVLDIERDEVNCHSRFLKVLLDYEKPGDEAKENLMDFLQRIVGVDNVDSFKQGVRVERESDHIDIQITTNDKQHAVVIENKIGAPDQWRQLCRYYRMMKDQGYGNVRLLYLKLNGDNPGEISFCGPDCEARSHCKAISYRNTLSWLERCQQRAYDQPELRESVAQYRRLVQKLTGMDFKGAYMNELMALCLEGEGSNLSLLHDFQEVLGNKVQPHLVQKLWCDIDVALKEEISDLPDKDDSEGDLVYPLGGGAFLRVTAYYTYLGFGVYCAKSEHPERHDALREALGNVNGGRATDDWPWWYHPHTLWVNNTSPKALMQLMEPNRKDHARGIARDLKPVWEAVKAAGLAGQNP